MNVTERFRFVHAEQTATRADDDVTTCADSSYRRNGSALTINAAIPGFGALVPETGKLLAGQQTPQQTADQLQVAFEQAKTAAGL